MSVQSPARRLASPAGGSVRDPGVSHDRGFWVVAYAFAVTMAFSTVPTPLYVVYERRDGFSAFGVTVVFAAYAVGVVASLFLAGHLSDWMGRRRILLPALGLEMLAAVLFVLQPSLGGLLVARVLTGFGVGMVTATATAYLSELHAIARPTQGRARAELVSTAANLGGLGLGPLVSGLLAQFVGGPLRVPYLVFLVLLSIGAAGVALVPETVRRPVRRPAYRPQRVRVPDSARRRYFAAAGAAFAGFAVLGLFTSLAPTFVAGTLHHSSRALAGVVAMLVFGAAALAQARTGRARPDSQLAGGLLVMAVGLIPVTAGIWFADLAPFLLGGVIAGAGVGVLFKGAVSTVAAVADPGRRGETLAGLFLAAYLGLAVPILGLGVATRYVSTPVALLGFVAVLLAIVAAVGLRLRLPDGHPAFSTH
jgi:predicted MFS family arabinose efflux permease